MIICKSILRYALFSKQINYLKIMRVSYIQVTLVGAVSDIGRSVALLLKQNTLLSSLQLYDDDNRVHGVGLELLQIPGGPKVMTFGGDTFLPASVRDSHIVLLVSRTPRKPCQTREQMLATNALPVQKTCRALSEQNPDAFFAISTNPINSIIPFASALLKNYNIYDKFKVFGITHIDSARAKALLSTTLNINPHHVHLPVIGGHSDDTIVPLFSNILPSHYFIKPSQAEALTRILKKAGSEVLNNKLGNDSATLAMAWSINEFVDKLMEAIYGGYVIVNCFTANSNFGTKFFSGPTKVGPYGIIQTCSNLPMSEYERHLLNKAVPLINRDTAQGEGHVLEIENAKNLY